MPHPPGGKVNAANLNFFGLNVTTNLQASDILCISQPGLPNSRATVGNVAAFGGVPDPLLLGNGTEADPSLAFTSDPDTGIFRTAADQLGLVAGGVRVANLTEAAGVVQMIFPTQNDFANPSIAFGDGDTGFFEETPNNLSVAIGGARLARFGPAGFTIRSGQGNGPALMDEAASNINPVLIPDSADIDTGIGQAGLDQLSFIAGGVQIAQAAEVPGANQFIVAPGVVQNAAATPSLAFGDGDSGWFESSDDLLKATIAGVARFQFSGDAFQGENASGPAMLNEAASLTNPTLVPDKSDLDTGIGINIGQTDELSLISGGVTAARCPELLGTVQFIVPSQNDSGNPSIAFGDGNSGFFEAADDDILLSLDTISRWRFVDNTLEGFVANSAALLNEASSTTNPTLCPNKSDLDTGMGHRAANIGVLIAGAQNCMEFGEAGAAPLCGFYGTAAIALQTGVAVTAAGVHAALVNLGLITA